MGLKDIIESISIDVVLESIGAGFVIGVFLYLIFDGECQELFAIWAKTICG